MTNDVWGLYYDSILKSGDPDLDGTQLDSYHQVNFVLPSGTSLSPETILNLYLYGGITVTVH
jgi:hypothetical protein